MVVLGFSQRVFWDWVGLGLGLGLSVNSAPVSCTRESLFITNGQRGENKEKDVMLITRFNQSDDFVSREGSVYKRYVH